MSDVWVETPKNSQQRANAQDKSPVAQSNSEASATVPGNRAQRIAIQGELGSFSHQAAEALVESAEMVCCGPAAEVVQKLAEAEVDHAMLPVENSIAGSVGLHYDVLMRHRLEIQCEYVLRIRHSVIGPPGATLDTLREIYSHPVALAQCRGFFAARDHICPVEFYDTAGSVAHIMRMGDPTVGAIASEAAAALYGGVVLEHGVEDDPENYTRFWLLCRAGDARVRGSYAGQNEIARKLTVKIAAAQEDSGALTSALDTFSAAGLRLAKLEGRPIPGTPWKYIYLADVVAPDAWAAEDVDEVFRRALVHLQPLRLQVMGQYPVLPMR